MIPLIALVTRLGIPVRFAKPALIAALVAVLILAIGVAKCSYDRSVIAGHAARADAATAKADRKADDTAAVQRRADDSRLSSETTALEKVRIDAPDPVARRLARHRCLRLQQSARAAHREPPACQ